MKNRASSHLIALLLIVAFEIVGYVAVYRAALLRGYEPSMLQAARDLLLYVPIVFLIFWISRRLKFRGNWTLYTTAVLLFSIGMLVQFRLYSDPEFGSRRKAEARAEKTQTLRLRYIDQYYNAEKKQLMGMNATPPTVGAVPPPEERRRNEYTTSQALTSSATWIPIASFLALLGALWLCLRDKYLNFLQRHSFIIVLATFAVFIVIAELSKLGKFMGNTTPWEITKIPFLVGFAGVLALHYRDLARTYWGFPRARDVLPLLVIGSIPFVLFLVLEDFGQVLVFSSAYVSLYLIAVRRWPQLLVFVGSVVLGAVVLVVGALPPDVQEKVPSLTTLATPVRAILPPRIKQRFHLWLDGFNPPDPSMDWWKQDYEKALDANPKLKGLAAEGGDAQREVNVSAWFDRIAYQPAQATFGIAAGGTTGRGLGLGFAEVIPIADSDYIYAAIGEELGLLGGAIVIIALIVFVNAGVRTAIEARDMFTKLCATGLTAFIGFQALVNIGGTTRALPMTGITLPFVSHGGFSLITSFAMLGMLLAFSHRNARDAEALPATGGTTSASRSTTIAEREDDEEILIPEAVE